MEYFPAPLENLVEQFRKLPGIGGKSAQRLAFHLLSLPDAEAEAFAAAILEAKRTVTCCPVCQNLTAGGLCPICASPRRDRNVICVVADPRDVVAMERSKEYRGVYHVLHGVISPMNHVGPDDLHIKSLLDRVAEGTAEEVIMATNPDTEGEATAMYLATWSSPTTPPSCAPWRAGRRYKENRPVHTGRFFCVSIPLRIALPSSRHSRSFL